MNDKESKREPQNEDEWRIRALNIQGDFFERWCRQAIHESGVWRVIKPNVAVSYPRTPPLQKDGNLDIVAGGTWDATSITLLVECKKNNPEFIEWVFFRSIPHSNPYDSTFLTVQKPAKKPGFELAPDLDFPRIIAGLQIVPLQMMVADEGRETRGNYFTRKKTNDHTRTANNSIYDAAKQVVIALMSIHFDEMKAASDALARKSLLWDRHVFIPIIVTTAKLYVLDFDPRYVDGGTGEIDFDRVGLSDVPFLLYRFPCPPSLQGHHFNKPDMLLPQYSPLATTDILIVNSLDFEAFLRFLYTKRGAFS